MIKPASLREALIRANPHISTSPDNFALFIDEGEVHASLSHAQGWRYQYTLNIVLVDYAGHPDSIFAPLLAWVATHQSDLLQNPDRPKISFEVEILNDQTYDIAIKLKLTESVVISTADGKAGGALIAQHMPEYVIEGMEAPGAAWELYLHGVETEWPITDPDNVQLP